MVPYNPARLLIITADDFGASKNINEGIKFAANNGAITAISVLSNFEESLSDLKTISEKHQEISIGVHLNIFTGIPLIEAEQVPSLVDNDGVFYTVDNLLLKTSDVVIDELKKELREQILVFKKYNIKVSFLSDQCGVLSMYPPFFNVITELAKEFNIPVRSPVSASRKYPDLFSKCKLNKYGRKKVCKCICIAPFKAIKLLTYTRINEMEQKVQKLDELGILYPDVFIVNFWGNPTASNLIYILEHLPAGTSELVLHFGNYIRDTNCPSGLDTDYFKNRECELTTVTSNYIKEYINYLNIKTIGYSEIPNKTN
ncbi:MAG: ChbG/HpnK family deacetylase [Bacteroidota bacterium]